MKKRRSKTPEYKAWQNMKTRCFNPNIPEAHNYSGKGITVCDKWARSFAAFLADMGPRPSPQHSLDRIDNNGHYEPDNCRWATPEQQARNTSTNRIVHVDGVDMTLAEAVERAPVPYNTVLYRLKRGWSLKNALCYPAKKGFRP